MQYVYWWTKFNTKYYNKTIANFRFQNWVNLTLKVSTISNANKKGLVRLSNRIHDCTQ